LAKLRVRELAEERGMGLKKLSRLADVNEMTIRKIWRPADYPNYSPTIPILERIADTLKVPLTDLFVPPSDEPPL
jgi:transcriptional regulator with XRE-family HTH domain